MRKNFLFSSKIVSNPVASATDQSLSSSSSFNSSLNQIDNKSDSGNINNAGSNEAIAKSCSTHGINANYANVFCECGGLANLLGIILHRPAPVEEPERGEHQELLKLCMDLLYDLIRSSSSETNEMFDFILEQDRFIKAFLLVVERCIRFDSSNIHKQGLLEKAISINKALFVENTVDYQLSNNVVSFFQRMVKE